MNSLEYMIKKNELVKKVTGKVLIPKEQLVNIQYSDAFEPSKNLSIINCPYCNIYHNSGFKCSGCPMDEANNNCKVERNSYRVADSLWYKLVTEEDRNELFELGLEYKKSNE